MTNWELSSFNSHPWTCAHWAVWRAFSSDFTPSLSALPAGGRYAIELRNVQVLGEEYAAILRECSATHCVNLHPSMPLPHVQCEKLGGLPPGPLVVRWMLGRGMRYQEALDRYEPFDRIVDDDPESREEIVRLVLEACRRQMAARADTLVLVNNKAEGSSPLSVFRLAERIVEDWREMESGREGDTKR